VSGEVWGVVCGEVWGVACVPAASPFDGNVSGGNVPGVPVVAVDPDRAAGLAGDVGGVDPEFAVLARAGWMRATTAVTAAVTAIAPYAKRRVKTETFRRPASRRWLSCIAPMITTSALTRT
jgi:hypothetical protein